jgi:hypothetical protein
MNQSSDLQPLVSTECPGQRRKVGHGKPARSGPPGNKNAVKHGFYTYKAMLNGSGLDERTSLFKAMRDKERKFIDALGGDPSPQEQVLIADTVQAMLFKSSLTNYLMGLKSLVRKRKAHPVLAIITQLSSQIRENLKTLGLKRVSKTLLVQELLNGHDETESDGKSAVNDNDKPEAVQ